jgi:hypothetical protein
MRIDPRIVSAKEEELRQARDRISLYPPKSDQRFHQELLVKQLEKQFAQMKRDA